MAALSSSMRSAPSSKTLLRLGLNVEPVRGVGRPSEGFGITSTWRA